ALSRQGPAGLAYKSSSDPSRATLHYLARELLRTPSRWPRRRRRIRPWTAAVAPATSESQGGGRGPREAVSTMKLHRKEGRQRLRRPREFLLRGKGLVPAGQVFFAIPGKEEPCQPPRQGSRHQTPRSDQDCEPPTLSLETIR